MICKFCGGEVFKYEPFGALSYTECHQCKQRNCQVDEAEDISTECYEYLKPFTLVDRLISSPSNRTLRLSGKSRYERHQGNKETKRRLKKRR
jgi:hypothetical protein